MIADALLAILGSGVVLLSLPGTLTLLVLTSSALRYRSPPLPDSLAALRVAVVMPAHDEANHIAASLTSLAACQGNFRTVVVADNCSDDTAAIASAAGAEVLIRDNPNQRGKGYALDFAFNHLGDSIDAVLVVDADTRVERNFVVASSAHLASGAAAVQCRYRVDNPSSSRRARLMNIALLAFNLVRPRGRASLGLSAGILGNGFGLRRSTLVAVPYTAHSVVEDLEYHLRLVRHRLRVDWVDYTTVWSAMPDGGSAARSQRSRWEGGRLAMLRDHAPHLLRDLITGQGRLLEPLADLLLLPLAFHGLLVLVALLWPWLPSQIYAGCALIVMIGHVVVAMALGRCGWRDGWALFGIPFYIAWKITLLPALLRGSRRNAAWVRTGRDQQPPQGPLS